MASKNYFRIGKVRGDLRGKNWYLTYHEHGRRIRTRVGPDRGAARQLAAQVNSQLELGSSGGLTFQQLQLAELRKRWLEHHEQVRRSSLQTIGRYRTATEHLLRFIEVARAPQTTSHFRASHAEQFVQYLRNIEVSPNGHPNSPRRPLLDKGIKYILECCRGLFNFAVKQRYLPPYADNPFAILELERIPVENAKKVVLLTASQERQFLETCDDWQLPLFATLIMTGLRLGELTHLVLPDDLDLEMGVLRVRNKPELGWQVKTRTEREIPLLPPLIELLRAMLERRSSGVVFRRRRFSEPDLQEPRVASVEQMYEEIEVRICHAEAQFQKALNRQQRATIAKAVWREAGLIKAEQIRIEFMRLTAAISAPELTSPKMLRHLFATTLQEGRVDPLIRCELMGHSIGTDGSARHGLGMTANYTQTRQETKRTQLEDALSKRPVWGCCERSWKAPLPV